MYKLLFSPLLSLFLFILGGGLLSILTNFRLEADQYTTLAIGVMNSAYYGGLVVGSFRAEKFILRVGHIRAFSFFASVLAVVSILQGVYVTTWFWLLMRIISGFVTAGLFIVIESWLLIIGDIKTRAKILAFYMVTLYAGQSLGHLLINIGRTSELLLFAIVSMLSSLSIIPLSVTKIGQPEIHEPTSLNFFQLYKLSSSGVIGCLCSGLILGAIYGLLALFVKNAFSSKEIASIFMSLTIFGGMALQYPLGRLSDKIERRLVLSAISILVAIISIFAIFSFHYTIISALVIFIFGGLTFALYPISISHTCDSLKQEHIVSATQGLLLTYGIGATIGPIIAAVFVHFFGYDGLFIYFFCISSFLFAFFLWRKTQAQAPKSEELFVVMPQTTPVTAELDPRSDEDTPLEV